MPAMKKTPCRMCTPYSPSSSCVATAQPPAKAAPNTSAPIRIAALSTVSTFCHAIVRLPVGLVARLIVSLLYGSALGRVARLRAHEARLHQRGADALDLGAGELDQRRAAHRPRQAAEQHQRLLHAVVHVRPGIGIEHPRQRIDAVIEAARLGEVVRLGGAE